MVASPDGLGESRLGDMVVRTSRAGAPNPRDPPKVRGDRRVARCDQFLDSGVGTSCSLIAALKQAKSPGLHRGRPGLSQRTVASTRPLGAAAP